ncbi:MAG: hypothetical protein HY909_17495 [Deltaproteobacteria bacterium]|nr:hypothetical protein [Deltaproteobacteria bacterium]
MRFTTILVPLVPLLVACSDSAGVVQNPPTDSGMDAAPLDSSPGPDRAPEDSVRMDTTAPDTAPQDTAVAVDSAADTAEAAFRCGADGDCAGNPGGAVCDTATGRCVGCVTTRDTCPAGQYCVASSGTCAPGCADDRGCAGDAGARGARCDPMTHGCVECVADEHCPAGRLCVGSVCVAGCTAARACPSGQSCCGGACVDPLANTAHCGRCDNRCMVPNATPACMNGTCAVGMCAAPFGDCDAMAANGCETDTRASAAHCGGCGMACAARSNAATSCAGGACAYACATGFADCDTMPANGCEADTRSSAAHCGGCGRACMPPNATGACVDGACTARCDAGFGDCDRNVTNGCETDTRASASHCGMCGVACPSRPNALPACAAGRCALLCVAGFADCNGDEVDGCEVDTRTAAAHCGGCGRSCAAVPGATATCVGSVCGSVCDAGLADCDMMAANGCETDTRTSAAHCGRCGVACAAGSACTAGACAPLASCAAIHRRLPALPSGEYTIDPDGAEGAAPFAVFCEMAIDGGGWTLLGTAHNFPPAGAPARRWDTEAALAGPGTFGALSARTTDNFKSPAWAAVAGADLLVLTNEYHFGFRGLLGDRAFQAFVSRHPEWTRDACSTTWIRSGVDFASEGITADTRRSLGFSLRGLDVNGATNGCFPGIAPTREAGTNENSAFGFSAGPSWWVWGWGNTPLGQSDWRPYDLSLFNLATLNSQAGACTSDYPAGRWPCNTLGRWMNGNAYDRSDKVRYGQLYVR